MSIVEKLKIGSTSYDVRDVNTYRSLSTAQAIHLDDTLASEAGTTADGLYNGEEVTSGEIFTSADGIFKQYSDTILPTTVQWAEASKNFIAWTSNDNNTEIFAETADGKLWRSNDAENWTEMPAPTRSYNINSSWLQYFNGTLYLAECYTNYNNYLAIYTFNEDSQQWTGGQSHSTGNDTYHSFAVGLLENVLTYCIRVYNQVYFSIDQGSTWEISSGYPTNYMPVKYLGNKFVTSDGFTGISYATSKTSWVGINWYSDAQNANVKDFTYDGEKYICINWDQSIVTTTDFTNYNIYTNTNIPTSNTGEYRIGYLDGIYLVLVSNNKIYTTADVTTWELNTEDISFNDGNLGFSSPFGFDEHFFFHTNSENKSYVGVYTATHERALIPLSYNKSEIDNKNYLQNTATHSRSIGIKSKTPNSTPSSVTIGYDAKANDFAVAVGGYTKTSYGSVSIGVHAGEGNYDETNYSQGSVSIGMDANSSSEHVVGPDSIAIGPVSGSYGFNAIAIGSYATVMADRAIQLGPGENEEKGSLYFGNGIRNYRLVRINGLIPIERLGEVIITGEEDPDGSTKGTLGLLYKNTTTGKIFRCTHIELDPSDESYEESDESYTPDIYTWSELVDASNVYTKEEVNQLIEDVLGEIETRLSQV